MAPTQWMDRPFEKISFPKGRFEKWGFHRVSLRPISSRVSDESLALTHSLEWCQSFLHTGHFQSTLFLTDSKSVLTLPRRLQKGPFVVSWTRQLGKLTVQIALLNCKLPAIKTLLVCLIVGLMFPLFKRRLGIPMKSISSIS